MGSGVASTFHIVQNVALMRAQDSTQEWAIKKLRAVWVIEEVTKQNPTKPTRISLNQLRLAKSIEDLNQPIKAWKKNMF